MALVRALAADGEQVTNTERVVTGALSVPVTVFLPAVVDGNNGTVAADYTVTVYNNSTTQPIVVMDLGRHILRVVQVGEAIIFTALAGSLTWTAEREPVLALQTKAAQEAAPGSTTVVLGTTSPATTAAIYKWIKLLVSDGTPCFFPVWK